MNMNRVVSLAILAAGILLIIFGIRESESLNSDISRFFSGSPTDRAIWMLIGGVVATIVGLAALSFGRLRGSRGN
jgi:divalent metal cation (Fe/Co/Zn/Cd) transporter